MSWAGTESTERWGCSWVCSHVWNWQACLFKVAFLVLGLHHGVSPSKLDPKALTKVLLFMDCCHICGGGAEGWGPPELLILLTSVFIPFWMDFLVGKFRPFLFKVNIINVGFESILLFIFDLSYLFLVHFSLFPTFFWIKGILCFYLSWASYLTSLSFIF